MISTAQTVNPLWTKHRGWVRMAFSTAVLVFCPLFLPVASANCRGAAPTAQTVPTMPDTASLSQPLAGQVAVLESESDRRGESGKSIVGLWNVTFISGGAVVDVGFDAWNAGGTEILNDYTDPINGNVCLGVWQQTGPRTYKLKHPSWYFDNSGNLLGTVIINETIHLAAEANSYTGSYTYDIYDVSGNFQEELKGEIKGTRIKPD